MFFMSSLISNQYFDFKSVTLAQGRYKWRHDQVLKTLANLVEEKKNSKDNLHQTRQKIHFLKEGEKPNLD